MKSAFVNATALGHPALVSLALAKSRATKAGKVKRSSPLLRKSPNLLTFGLHRIDRYFASSIGVASEF